jgi:hypothetical protein
MHLIDNVPMLICRIRLSLVIIQTADYVGWRSDFTVAGTANELHIDSPLNYSTFFNLTLVREKKQVKFIF